MSVTDDYLGTLGGPEQELLDHMYGVIRRTVPGVTEEMSYAMPAFKKDGKAFMAIMSNEHFMSVYPFCSINRLGVDLRGYETTKGSIHFTAEHLISDELLRQIIKNRLELADR